MAIRILKASWTPVYLTIPVYDLVRINTNELINVISTTAFKTLFQFTNLTETLYCIRMAINKARSVAPKSNKRIKNFGTILKFLNMILVFDDCIQRGDCIKNMMKNYNFKKYSTKQLFFYINLIILNRRRLK